MKLKFSTIDDVKAFVNLASQQGCDLDIVSGRHTIDAKSIMGILSLDLSKPIDFVVHLDGEEKKRVEGLFAAYSV